MAVGDPTFLEQYPRMIRQHITIDRDHSEHPAPLGGIEASTRQLGAVCRRQRHQLGGWLVSEAGERLRDIGAAHGVRERADLGGDFLGAPERECTAHALASVDCHAAAQATGTLDLLSCRSRPICCRGCVPCRCSWRSSASGDFCIGARPRGWCTDIVTLCAGAALRAAS